ncbi:DNA-directed RNA polymerase subunit alpha [Mycoplasmopsis agassizii]|uniref:DNA-directed RNA polymerase subunit alpha n=1 Tax=Mycoplasmopsis agassizii TaxID=33922 RepID=A0A269TJT9_9BACT|nr:DNA-directed RNA polymerase subunit alpha [Mycoplasmopsis agassizii]PAK21681.1 DNA-directed RNA polymerase subunit alpha [Mycoplasmopsis agassizii]
MRAMPQIYYSEDKARKVSDTNTVFVIKPLERGFASTIGTAIRRTMLSTITSAAPFAIKIKGLEHEMATIKGVVEDVQSIILNVRAVNFIYDPTVIEDGKFYRGNINVSGRVVKASDITFDLPIKVFNSEQVIATLSAETSFQMEIFIMSGRGFVDFETNKMFIEEHEDKLVSNIKKGKTIAVDSNFSPVKRVKINTSEINTSSVHIEEQLEIELETNGTVSGKEIMSTACEILISHFQVIGNIDNLDKINIFEEKSSSTVGPNNSANKDIKDLNLSVRSLNALQRHGYSKLSDIATLTEDDLASVKNLGKKSVDEILALLKEYNISLSKGDK